MVGRTRWTPEHEQSTFQLPFGLVINRLIFVALYVGGFVSILNQSSRAFGEPSVALYVGGFVCIL
jgi:hypothetical protein